MDTEKIFRYKTVNSEKASAFGFVDIGGGICQYTCEIMNKSLALTVRIGPEARVEYSVFDMAAGDEYTLVKIAQAQGPFLEKVRKACEEKLSEIAQSCFETDIFRGEQTRRMLAHIEKTYGVKPEYLWERFPDCAAFRHAGNKKWFAVIMTADKKKLSPLFEGPAEIIALKTDPEKLLTLVDERTYFQGYHMNKKHWYSVILDDSVADDSLFECLKESFVRTQ